MLGCGGGEGRDVWVRQGGMWVVWGKVRGDVGGGVKKCGEGVGERMG